MRVGVDQSGYDGTSPDIDYLAIAPGRLTYLVSSADGENPIALDRQSIGDKRSAVERDDLSIG
jgi:hypothetical protein